MLRIAVQACHADFDDNYAYGQIVFGKIVGILWFALLVSDFKEKNELSLNNLENDFVPDT